MKAKGIFLTSSLAIAAMFLSASTAVQATTGSLPDLVVKNVQVVRGCKMKVTLANIGRGPLPQSAYGRRGVGIQMYNDGEPWGGIILKGVDPGKKLAKPGGTVSFLWFPRAANLKLKPGTNNIKVIVDNSDSVRESNEHNNSWAGNLTCGGTVKLPDLTVTNMGVDRSCRVWVTVKNAGPGMIPDNVWTSHSPKSAGVYLYNNGKKWGGASIWKFDPAKKLQRPGGTATYTSTLQVHGTATIKGVVDLWNKVKEANEGNNGLQRRLNCGGGGGGGAVQAKPDVGLYGFMKIGKRKRLVQWNESITLSPADAHLVSHGHPAFDIYYGFREYQGHPARGFKNKLTFNGKVVSIQSNLSLDGKQIRQVATQAYMGPNSGRLCLKVDADNQVSESREDNNYGCVNVRFTGFSGSRPAIDPNKYREINRKPHVDPGPYRNIPHKKPNVVLPNEKVQGGALAR